jgi:diguanylate cyclase (GGDEF)-like protein
VIEGLARLLLASTRAGDAACRYGGEEFVLVMPGAGPDAALERIDNLRECFAGTPFTIDGDTLNMTFSAGVACFPEHGRNAQTLLVEADRALYESKAAGRNQVRTAGVSLPWAK